MNPRKKVFISSTFRDLRSHREEIWKRLQNIEIDILGMEMFGARKSTPIETCLDEVEKSDIYIGIISLRAGTIHPTLGKSYTELEYEKALSLNLEIWIYLIDEQNGIIKSGDIDFGNSYNYLHEFKERLKRLHTVDFFKDEKDLGNKIFKKLNEFIPKTRSKIKRPEILDCDVYRFSSPNYRWYIFLGLLNDLPYEIITGVDEKNVEDLFILIPKSITTGKIKETKDLDDKIKRYDFQYITKRGYKTTLEGINYSFIPEISLRLDEKIIL